MNGLAYQDLERNNQRFAFSPICIVNEDFPPFIFSKTLADKLST